jgi:hypothetical protein
VAAKRRLQIEFAGVENVQNVVFWFGLLRDRCGKEAENQSSREREERGRSQIFARQKKYRRGDQEKRRRQFAEIKSP